jgi:hypothetical protein
MERDPGAAKGHRRRLVRRLRRLRRDWLQHQDSEGVPDLVQADAHARYGLQDRHQQQPDRSQCGFLCGVRSGSCQWGLVQQHQARCRLLPEAEQGRQFRGDRRRSLHRPERCDEHRSLVGLPAGLGDQLAARLRHVMEGRHPDRRVVRGVLRPGDQQAGPEPRGCAALGGVPLLDPRTEPVARGCGAPDRAALPRGEPPGRREGAGRPAAGTHRRHQLPDPGPVGQGQGRCRTVLAGRDGL